jgi:hypothetical protein
MDRGKWEIRGEVRKWTDVPLHIDESDGQPSFNLKETDLKKWVEVFANAIDKRCNIFTNTNLSQDQTKMEQLPYKLHYLKPPKRWQK